MEENLEVADLDKLSSGELHDRAVRQAVQRRDFGFLWRLLKEIPAAEAATSDAQRAETDILRVSGLVTDFFGAGEGELADALRPVYLDYLTSRP
ncbi:hypothetical protein [Actinocorallia longicatena]|uniref:Uncharacterized protein n=1 Tax=Actinocorallia longicatena TaxID=111803 RepID=A0ABP6QM38_9ACTN